MLAHGECTAPTFDKTKPRELLWFFDDLEYLIEWAAITSETEKKKQMVCYTDFDTEQVWKTFLEFKNNATTYHDFKQAILVHYLDALGDFIYSLRDMDSLISKLITVPHIVWLESGGCLLDNDQKINEFCIENTYNFPVAVQWLSHQTISPMDFPLDCPVDKH